MISEFMVYVPATERQVEVARSHLALTLNDHRCTGVRASPRLVEVAILHLGAERCNEPRGGDQFLGLRLSKTRYHPPWSHGKVLGLVCPQCSR